MAQIPSDAQRERRIQDRIEGRIANRFEKKLRADISKAIRAGADAYESERGAESAVADYDERIERDLEKLYTDAFTTMAERMQGMLDDAKGLPRDLERKEMSDTLKRAMRSFIGRWTARKVSQISSATREWIAAAIKRGIEDGQSVREVASQIRQRAGSISAWRANLISRTEVHSAANAGSQQAAMDSGIIRLKNWVPVNDGRTRSPDNSDFDHVNVESVPMNDPFIVSGEELQFPGDPSGSAGNIINCRCAMTYSTRG